MRVGFIGTGLMGLPMAHRILAAMFSLTAYNRTPTKLETLRAAGAAIAPTPVALIQAVDCLVLMLTDASAIHATLFSADSQAALAGKTVIQMGTIAPSESRAIAQQVAAAGGSYLEAPVLGSIPEAQAGTLLVMVGSTPAQFQQWQPLLQCFGPAPRLIGPVGTAAAVKLALNQLIGSLTAAFATSLGFVAEQGADVEAFMAILRDSALYAPTFDKKLQRIRDREFGNPNFPTKHLLKDVNLFLQEIADSPLNPALPIAVQQILDQAMEQGLAETDYSSLYTAIAPPHTAAAATPAAD